MLNVYSRDIKIMRYIYIYCLILPFVSIVPAPVLAQRDVPAVPEGVWSYDDDYTGQEDWGAVKAYAVCESGTHQSPINITYTKPDKLPALNFKYNNAEGVLKLEPNRSFIFYAVNGGKLTIGDDTYSLHSIEIHSPSSHRVKDGFYPAEIHLIHKNEKGDMLIVAEFVNIGAENPAIAKMIKQITERNLDKFSVNTDSLVSNNQSYYAYDGSLPYPPCTENAHWKIMKHPITISREQLSFIARIIGRNSRLPQPVYMREVLESTP